MRAYIFQTWVARGSSFASCSGLVSGSGEHLRSGEPDILGDVKALVVWGERGGRKSSENISVKMVDLESDGEDGLVADIQREGGRR